MDLQTAWDNVGLSLKRSLKVSLPTKGAVVIAAEYFAVCERSFLENIFRGGIRTW